MQRTEFVKLFCLWLLGLLMGVASLQAAAHSCGESSQQLNKDLQQWISRIEAAAKKQNYSGTYTIMQSNQMMTLATVHVYEGGSDYELVDALDGAERQVLRKNDAYYSIYPSKKKIILERQSVAKVFPSFVEHTECSQANAYYTLQVLGAERFIGRNADVIRIVPIDDLRYGYKAWVDQSTGLLLRLDTQSSQGESLQRVAFSSLNLTQAPANGLELVTHIDHLLSQGFELHEWPYALTNANKQGWTLEHPPVGFEPMHCILRPVSNLSKELIQWFFSDGLSSVSIFMEKTEDIMKTKESQHSYGATNGISYRQDQWQVTIVGEVPEATLNSFRQALKWGKINEK